MPAAPRRLADGFHLEGWTVVPRANEMVRPGETAHVEPTPMAVLVALAERAGEAVSRDELMAEVWPGVVVTDHALNRCISHLRKLFDDDPRAPRVIETIPRVGYRLIAPVVTSGDSLGPPEAVVLRPTPGTVRPELPAARTPWRVWGAVAGGLALVAALAVSVLPEPAPIAVETRALTVAPGVERAPAWSPDGTRLAYVAGDGRGGAIWVRDLAADTPVRLTDGPDDGDPAWSPGGDRIAFLRCDGPTCRVLTVSPDGGDPEPLAEAPVARAGLAWLDAETLVVGDADAPGLVRLDLVAGARERLTDGADLRPRVSSDGRAVAFVRRERAGQDLFVVPKNGGEPVRLTDDGVHVAGHTWSGGDLLFSSSRSGVYALWRVGVDGRGEPEAVTGPAVRDPGSLALRAGRLAVADWAYEINLWRSVDGAVPERVVASSLWDRYPALSADGVRLAFVSTRSGPPDLWTSTADGADLRRLTDLGGASVEAPRWSPDGRTLAAVVRGETASIALVPAGGGPLRLLTDDAADDLHPRWSRDGRSLYFGSRRGGGWAVWRVSASGGDPERVAAGVVGEELADGVLAVAREGGGLWRVEPGRERQIAPLAPSDLGDWVVTDAGVILPDPSGVRYVRLDPATGALEPLALPRDRHVPGDPSVAASADGRVVVIARADRVEADVLVAEPIE